MNNISERVTNCFANVFPDVSATEIPLASTASLKAWDSIAHITLLSAISEEFGIELEPEDYEELKSYPQIVEYVSARNNN
jgi:acyl carrier protein